MSPEITVTAAGNGITDDAPAFRRALDSCCAISAAGTIPTLVIPPGTYRLTYTRAGAIADPLDPAYATQWSFYDLAASAWGTVAPPYADQSPNMRALVVRGNGAVLLCDGSPGSYLLSSSGGMWRLDISDLTFRSYDPNRPIHGLGLRNCAHSTWSGVRFEDYEEGVGLYLCEQSERNTFTSLSYHCCKQGLVLGANQPSEWEAASTANENRFVGLNFIECGRRCSEAETLTTGFLEINNSQLPVFVGGSWKLNKNPAIFRLCYGGSFQGIYCEVNGWTYNPGQAGVFNSQMGYRNHMIFDARSSRITGTWTGAPVRNLTFSNCYFAPYSGVTFRASPEHKVAGVVFDNCTLVMDGHGFMYVEGEQSNIIGTTVRGVVFEDNFHPAKTGYRETHAIDPATGLPDASGTGLAVRYDDDGSGLRGVAAETAKLATDAVNADHAALADIATRSFNADNAINATNAVNAETARYAGHAATAGNASHAATADNATHATTAGDAAVGKKLARTPVKVLGQRKTGKALEMLLKGLESLGLIKDATR